MTHALIIDDSTAMRKILGKILKGIGFSIYEAENGAVGLEQLTAHADEIELVLVDWNMPVMNGYEFVQSVRSQSEFTNHKLVMVTTETEPARMVKALMAGADEFVMKPFTPDILLEKISLIGVKVPAAAE